MKFHLGKASWLEPVNSLDRNAKSKIKNPICLLVLAQGLLLHAAIAQLGDRSGEAQSSLPARLTPPPSPPLGPQEALATIQLDPELQLELVCAEPMVQDPVALSFDADGRFWVVEMRGFMPDVEGHNETAPVGRIRILQDTTSDGRPDRVWTFLDHLILPRAVAPTGRGALIADRTRLFFAEDLDGDLQADRVVLVDPEYNLKGNVEHQANGLMRGIDNWYYSANSKARYRFQDHAWVKEPTEFRGQWGIAQDNYGRLFYNVNYSQLHGDLAPPNVLNRNPNHPAKNGLNLLIATNQHVYPLRMNTGVNRAYRPGILDENGRLVAFTSACAPLIYRGDYLPPSYRNNAFVCEPAGNLVKRDILQTQGLLIHAAPAFLDREFIASTDERFRPIWLTTGLDGALYLTDMYRGILQHKDYISSHLRNEILARDLEKPIHWGRIYRVRRRDMPPTPCRSLSSLSSPDLLNCLSDPNGPIRDAAQRLLVERGERAVLPGLIGLTRSAPTALGRIHALWTLEGLGAVAPQLLLPALADDDFHVRIAALRVLQTIGPVSAGQADHWAIALLALSTSGPLEVQFHAVLAAGALPITQRQELYTQALRVHVTHPLFRDAVLSGLGGYELSFLQTLLRETKPSMERAGWDALFSELAAALARSRIVPDLVELLAEASSGGDWREQALQAGITLVVGQPDWKPISLPHSDEMSRAQNAEALFGQLFTWPGRASNLAPPIPPLTDLEKHRFSMGREQFVAMCAPCHGVDGQGLPSLAPPLALSNWVLGRPDRLAGIVLHGLEGPLDVNGVRYGPPLTLPDMPSLSALSDETIASILTYLRRAWDHGAEPVTPELVAQVRKQTLARKTPFNQNDMLP